jgi:toxin-antitoxin system PIN domain toxin
VSVSLLDVNVLIALFDPSHIHHEGAHRWFALNHKYGWATCPLTLNGCVRILSNPAYPTVAATPAEVIARLRAFCSNAHHEFWADSVSLLDEALFRSQLIRGHGTVTDIYLLGLAVRHHGRLATFDGAISWRPVAEASPRHIALID